MKTNCIPKRKKLKYGRLKRQIRKNNSEHYCGPSYPRIKKAVELEWGRFKTSFVEAAEKVCGQKSGRRRYKETPWWTDRIKEAVRRKNNAWREWFKEMRKEKKKRNGKD
jgi:hypothetical protein